MNNSESIDGVTEEELLKLLLRNEPALRAYARILLPDWSMVEEALQEASIAMWQKRAQLQSVNAFLSWARTFVRYKCLAQLQKLPRQRAVIDHDLLVTIADECEAANGTMRTDEAEQFRRCFARFSPEQRELLLAPYSPEKSITALAQLRRTSANALYKKLARLREKLSDCVQFRLAEEGVR